MESVLKTEAASFEKLLSLLISAVNLRVKNGEYTERGLSRILGISQSHMTPVLKGARTLHTDLADRLLGKFGISILHLFEEDELSKELRARLSSPEFRAIKKPVRHESSLRSKDRAIS